MSELNWEQLAAATPDEAARMIVREVAEAITQINREWVKDKDTYDGYDRLLKAGRLARKLVKRLPRAEPPNTEEPSAEPLEAEQRQLGFANDRPAPAGGERGMMAECEHLRDCGEGYRARCFHAGPLSGRTPTTGWRDCPGTRACVSWQTWRAEAAEARVVELEAERDAPEAAAPQPSKATFREIIGHWWDDSCRKVYREAFADPTWRTQLLGELADMLEQPAPAAAEEGSE